MCRSPDAARESRLSEWASTVLGRGRALGRRYGADGPSHVGSEFAILLRQLQIQLAFPHVGCQPGNQLAFCSESFKSLQSDLKVRHDVSPHANERIGTTTPYASDLRHGEHRYDEELNFGNNSWDGVIDQL